MRKISRDYQNTELNKHVCLLVNPIPQLLQCLTNTKVLTLSYFDGAAILNVTRPSQLAT